MNMTKVAKGKLSLSVYPPVWWMLKRTQLSFPGSPLTVVDFTFSSQSWGCVELKSGSSWVVYVSGTHQVALLLLRDNRNLSCKTTSYLHIQLTKNNSDSPLLRIPWQRWKLYFLTQPFNGPLNTTKEKYSAWTQTFNYLHFLICICYAMQPLIRTYLIFKKNYSPIIFVMLFTVQRQLASWFFSFPILF